MLVVGLQQIRCHLDGAAFWHRCFRAPRRLFRNHVRTEGRDLFNFGSTSVSGHSEVSLAVGARYKVNESLQFGLIAEVPLTAHRDLMDYRVTFDVIFRY